jgi:hypothetical protein
MRAIGRMPFSVRQASVMSALAAQFDQIFCGLAVRAAVIPKFAVLGYEANTALMLALLRLGHDDLLGRILPFFGRPACAFQNTGSGRAELLTGPGERIREVRVAGQWLALLIQEQHGAVVHAEQQDRTVLRGGVQLIDARVGECWRATYDAP